MAVPKQKKGRGATHTRRSASKLAMPCPTCPQCGARQAPAPRVPHLLGYLTRAVRSSPPTSLGARLERPRRPAPRKRRRPLLYSRRHGSRVREATC